MEPEPWLAAAAAYLPEWLAFLRRQLDLPGLTLAIAHHGQPVLDIALGHADLSTHEILTPRHRFRVASHSKTFTAVGVLRLREQGRLGLDNAVGRHIPNLHPDVAAGTLTQLLSHGAGLIRNGRDGTYWSDDRAFPDAAEIIADLTQPPILPAESRFKYSNHGYALLGLLIEAVTGEPYAAWIMREVITPFGLHETLPDAPLPPSVPFARGHTHTHPLGARLTIPGDNVTHAAAPATGFVSTAADLARFFAQLSPTAAESPLSVASRRALVHRQWRNPHVPFESHYGLGTSSGAVHDWEWFGHSGSFQGYASRTAVVPDRALSVSLLANAVSAPTDFLVDGALRVLHACARRGPPKPELADWHGRWWTTGGALDLLPLGDRVLMAVPAFYDPVSHVSEITVEAPDRGRIALANGYGSQGESVELVRGPDGAVAELHVAGTRALPEAAHIAALRSRYGVAPPSQA